MRLYARRYAIVKRMTRAEIAAYVHLPEWVIQFAQERGELQSGECSQATVDGWLRFRAERAALIVRSLAPADDGGGGGQTIPPARGYVYFYCTSDLAMVKIGWSAHPVQRLRALQTAHATPLAVLGVVPGTLGEEAAWHRAVGTAAAPR